MDVKILYSQVMDVLYYTAYLHGCRCTTVNASSTSVTCQCNHLTEFSAGATTPRCGDGLLGPSEQCDDGNLVSGDGCSSTCKVCAFRILCNLWFVTF